MARSKGKDFGAAMAARVARTKEQKTVTEQAIDRLSGGAQELREVPQEPAGTPAEEDRKAAAGGGKGRKTGRINLRVPEDLLSDIEAMAHFNQETITGYLVRLAEKDLSENASMLSAFRKMQELRDDLNGEAR